MFSKPSFLALTVGIGLSLALSACAGGDDSDPDFDGDAPEKTPMNGGNGFNGGLPTAVGPCIKGIALAAWNEQGRISGNFNPNMHKFRCAGYISTDPYVPASDGPVYANRPLDVVPPLPNVTENDVVESMVWAGVSANETVTYTNPGNGQVFPYQGRGFLSTAWEGQRISNSPGLSDFIALVVAKMNAFPTPVPLYVEGDHIVRDDPQGNYTVLESVIVASYGVNMLPTPWAAGEILFFKANLPARECRDPETYYKQRTCHDPVNGSCVPGLQVLSESDLPTWCVNGEGAPAQTLYDKGLTCMGHPAFRVWVKEGALKVDASSPCVN